MNADWKWKVGKAQYAEFNVPTCGKIALTVMMAWIWHVWINAMVFVPMAQAPPKAGANDRATYFTQTPKKNKNEFWNCHLAMLGRVAKPIFTSLCRGQPLRVWVCEWITGFKKWNRLRAIGY